MKRHAVAIVLLPLALVAAGVKESATPREVDRGATCPSDMLEIDGEYCPYVEQLCLHWLDPPKAEPKLRCAEFKKTPPCKAKTEKKHFDFQVRGLESQRFVGRRNLRRR